jgi:hypothetical protein
MTLRKNGKPFSRSAAQMKRSRTVSPHAAVRNNKGSASTRQMVGQLFFSNGCPTKKLSSKERRKEWHLSK